MTLMSTIIFGLKKFPPTATSPPINENLDMAPCGHEFGDNLLMCCVYSLVHACGCPSSNMGFVDLTIYSVVNNGVGDLKGCAPLIFFIGANCVEGLNGCFLPLVFSISVFKAIVGDSQISYANVVNVEGTPHSD